MAEITADLSSYPKPVAARGLVDQVKDLAGLEQQKLGIDKQKLDLVNQRFGYLAKGLTQLSDDPELNEDKIRNYTTNMVKMGLVPNDMGAKFISTLPPTQGLPPDQARAALQQSVRGAMQQAQSMQEAINFQHGQPGLLNRGPDVVPVRTPGVTGAPIQTGAPISLGVSPEVSSSPQPIYDNGTVYQGTRGQYMQRVGVRQPSNSLYNNVEGSPKFNQPQQQPQLQQRQAPVQQPPITQQTDNLSSLPKAPPLNAEESRKAYSQAINEAPALLDATKPLIQVIPLLDGLTTGIGTPEYNKAVAALTNIGWLKGDERNSAVITQIVNKKLNSFVQQFGSRSDKAQLLNEGSSPNTGQLNPALVHLTMDAIAYNRMKAARAIGFKSDPKYKGNQDRFQEYDAETSAYQNPDAYKMDLLPKEKQAVVFQTQLKKAQAGDKGAQNFIRSLALAKKLQ